MARRYINGEEVNITKTDFCSVDVEFDNGEKIANVEPKRLFPVSNISNYITLMDENGKEQAIIRAVERLKPDSKKAINECLREYYLVPKILKLNNVTEKFGVLKWSVETDRGDVVFEILHRHSDIKLLYDGRVIIKDSNDNRYEIPDYRALDKHSVSLLNSEL